jgi:DNA-binding FrmR family transcriptional regulator
VIGQLNGVKGMLERDEDCLKTLTQMKAARAGLDRIMADHLQQNLSACMQKGIKPGKVKEMEGLLKELAKR